MHPVFRGVARIAAIAALATTLTAVPAAAAPITFDVSPGGAINAFEGRRFVGANLNGHFAVYCNHMAAQGTANGGAEVSGDNIVTLDSVNFSGCSHSGLYTAEVTALGLPWHFDATGPSTSTTTHGKLTGFKLMVQILGTGCIAIVAGPGGSDGFVEVVHTNPSPTGHHSSLLADLLLENGNVVNNGNLVVTSKESCADFVGNVGDRFVHEFEYLLKPGQTIS